MLQYPSILGVKKVPKGFPCVAFYKYDGSTWVLDSSVFGKSDGAGGWIYN